MSSYKRLSCGNCGCKTFLLQADENWVDVRCVCTSCGCASYLAPKPVLQKVEASWGRKEQGDRNDGVLCVLPSDDR